MGSVAVLNVGAGDTKLTFDKNNPAESIRAGRIVRDMIRRGYALLIEVERGGEKRFERALDFDEKTSEYIIADFDPQHSEKSTVKPLMTTKGEPLGEESTTETGASDHSKVDPPSKRKGRTTRRVPASGTRAVSVARSAGG